MGKGLGLSSSSKHVHMAFTAGTGILTFIDLVYRIYLQNINKLPDKCERLHPQFKLVLYVSFQDRASSCCLELCE